MAERTSHIPLRGGLDLVTSQLFIDPGRIWRGVNYEPVEGGYERTGGYERIDGRPSPSDASYWVLTYTLGAGETSAVAGNTITGGTSGATAVVLKAVEVVDTGVGGGSEITRLQYVLGEVSGTFQDGEELQVSGAVKGSASGLPIKGAAANIVEDGEFLDLAAAHRRSLIGKVPGTGTIRGVWYYKDVLYAVRDDDSADPPTAARMYRSTTTGWDLVSLGHRIAFDAGSVEPTTGETLTGATSGATATLGHVVLTSGTWSGGDAAGTFWLNGVTGTFEDDENLQQSISGADTTVAVANGVASANALPAGGRYEFANHNFLGQDATRRMYGVNGAGKAFSFDGSQFIEIVSTHADDRPTHIVVWRNHLLLSFRGGSLISSETGNPDGFTAAKGAFEIGTGQEINGLARAGPGNILVVGDDRMQVLYGNDSADVQLADASDEETGGVEWTVQAVGSPLYMDNRGLRRFSPSDTYENFRIGTMTTNIQPFIEQLRNEAVEAVSSQRVRSRDQYRVWFESGIGICVYLGRRDPEISFLDYGEDDDGNKVIPRCSVSAEDANRIERVYFGTASGFVYEANRGRSFDGRKIAANIRLPLNHVGAPAIEKSFSEADIYIDLAGRTALSVSALFDDGLSPGTGLEEITATGGGGIWDESLWDTFYWDASLSGFITVDVLGSGRNVSLLIRSEEKTELPHTLSAISLYWMPEGARTPSVAA